MPPYLTQHYKVWIKGKRYNPGTGVTPSYTPQKGGARGVMVIVIGNGHGDSSSNPGQD